MFRDVPKSFVAPGRSSPQSGLALFLNVTAAATGGTGSHGVVDTQNQAECQGYRRQGKAKGLWSPAATRYTSWVRRQAEGRQRTLRCLVVRRRRRRRRQQRRAVTTAAARSSVAVVKVRRDSPGRPSPLVRPPAPLALALRRRSDPLPRSSTWLPPAPPTETLTPSRLCSGVSP